MPCSPKTPVPKTTGTGLAARYTTQMNAPLTPLDIARYRKARLSRDARFDGLFFVGVETTGIFCRPICPARAPKESNVTYYATALNAMQAGLRPCLRCRPESAPGSPAWQGVQTTSARAVKLIDEGEWRTQSLPQFAARLGVSDRYLRKLFKQHLGIAPLKYANFRRVLFAKQLLQQTSLQVADIAHMAGFGSTRRFNALFAELLSLTPQQIRGVQKTENVANNRLSVLLSYRPPYDWVGVRGFYRARQIAGLELVTNSSYSRSFSYQKGYGVFKATHLPEKNSFRIELSMTQPEHALGIVQRIRHLLDLDADATAIATQLESNPVLATLNSTGIRLPGLWSSFEAGVRAILGQQVSVKVAHKLVSRLVVELGKTLPAATAGSDVPNLVFPEPAAVAGSNLEFLAMPNKRRQALRLLAEHILQNGEDSTSGVGMQGAAYKDWLVIPGIGPWTVQYTAFRMGHPDIFLAGDLGVKNALKKLAMKSENVPVFIEDTTSPWGSYATLLLWQSLSTDVGENI